MSNWFWSSVQYFQLFFLVHKAWCQVCIVDQPNFICCLGKSGKISVNSKCTEVKDFSSFIVANIILWDMVCVFQVCVSVFQRSLCDFPLHQQSLTNWWKEIWSSSLCFGVYLPSTEMLHVRLHAFVFCLEMVSSVVKIMLCMLHKEAWPVSGILGCSLPCFLQGFNTFLWLFAFKVQAWILPVLHSEIHSKYKWAG